MTQKNNLKEKKRAKMDYLKQQKHVTNTAFESK